MLKREHAVKQSLRQSYTENMTSAWWFTGEDVRGVRGGKRACDRIENWPISLET